MRYFLEFLNNNDGLIALFSLITSLILVGVYIGVFIITRRYTNATKELARSSSESVEASRNFSNTTIQIEKDRLTYELIKEWNEDKKFLTYKRQELGIFKKTVNSMIAFSPEDAKKFINYLDNFFDYFLLVYKLISNDKINKDLYFEVLGREIIRFKYDQLEENTDISSDTRNMLRAQKIDIPVISDREWFDRIFKIANEEYKFNP